MDCNWDDVITHTHTNETLALEGEEERTGEALLRSPLSSTLLAGDSTDAYDMGDAAPLVGW